MAYHDDDFVVIAASFLCFRILVLNGRLTKLVTVLEAPRDKDLGLEN